MTGMLIEILKLNKNNGLKMFLIVLILVSLIFGITFNVPSGGEICFAEDLVIGEGVRGSFQVVSAGERNIDFVITGPANDSILNLSQVSDQRFSFVAQKQGIYKLCAKNPAAFSSKKLSIISAKVSKSALGMI
jgi:hypothetical protein